MLSRHALSIEMITTDTRDAPMTGGMIFEAHVVARLPPSSDPAAVRGDLEKLATELMVDISTDEKQGRGPHRPRPTFVWVRTTRARCGADCGRKKG